MFNDAVEFGCTFTTFRQKKEPKYFSEKRQTKDSWRRKEGYEW
jgi:hypothetical protein